MICSRPRVHVLLFTRLCDPIAVRSPQYGRTTKRHRFRSGILNYSPTVGGMIKERFRLSWIETGGIDWLSAGDPRLVIVFTDHALQV